MVRLLNTTPGLRTTVAMVYTLPSPVNASVFHNTRLHAGLAAVVAFLLYFCWYWGIPFDFNKDIAMVYGLVRGSSYPTLIGDLLNPLTPAWFFADNFAGLRPGQYVLAKILDSWGLFDLPAIHLISFVGVALLAAAIFFVIVRATNSIAFAWLGVLLYLTFPTHLFSLLSISPFDMQFFQIFLMLITLRTYWKTLLSEDLSPKAFGWRLAVVVALVWLNIKIHSSAKIMPGILLAVTLLPLALRALQGRGIPKRWFAALGTMLASFVLVIPFAPSPKASVQEQKTTTLHWDYALRRVFKSRAEGPFVLTSLHRPPPGSLTENLGFLLGWTFWISLFSGILGRFRTFGRINPADPFWPILIWFVFSLAGFAIGAPPLDHNNRYLNHGLVPAVLLLFLCMAPVLSSAKPAARAAKALFAGILLVTIAQNSWIYVPWMRHGVGLEWAIVQAEKAVYSDQHGKPLQDNLALHRFHFQMRPEKLLAQWEGVAMQRQAALDQALAKWGLCYYLSHDADPPELQVLQTTEGHVTLIEKIRFDDTPTVAFRLAKRLKAALGRDTPGKSIFVYRVIK